MPEKVVQVTEIAQRRRGGLLVELFWTRTGLLLLILMMIAGTLLTTAGAVQSGTSRGLLVAVGTGALVSALVTFAQTLLTATASRRVLVDSLVIESRKVLEELSAEYRSLNTEFFPTNVFEPSVERDPELTRLIMTDLRTSRQYLFLGFSARYASARLLLSDSWEREVRVVMADPKDCGSMGGRARWLLRYAEPGGDYEQTLAGLQDEIAVGLVGLYVARSRCTRIDVTVIGNPPLDRFEIFDDSVWVTLFSDPAAVGVAHPRMLRFARASFLYAMQRSELIRICNGRAGQHLVMHPDTTLEEFLTLFEQVTGRALSALTYDDLTRRFHTVASEFASSADRVPEAGVVWSG